MGSMVFDLSFKHGDVSWLNTYVLYMNVNAKNNNFCCGPHPTSRKDGKRFLDNILRMRNNILRQLIDVVSLSWLVDLCSAVVALALCDFLHKDEFCFYGATSKNQRTKYQISRT